MFASRKFRAAMTTGTVRAGIAAVAFVAAGSAIAQGSIKVGEMNSYKNFPAFLDPYKKGWELALEQANAAW